MHILLDNSGVPAAWLWLLATVGAFVAAFFPSASRAGGLWCAPVPRAMGSEATCRGVVGGTIARRRAATGRPAGLFFTFLTFALRLWSRDTSLHYTSEQFWLRIRGR